MRLRVQDINKTHFYNFNLSVYNATACVAVVIPYTTPAVSRILSI